MLSVALSTADRRFIGRLKNGNPLHDYLIACFVTFAAGVSQIMESGQSSDTKVAELDALRSRFARLDLLQDAPTLRPTFFATPSALGSPRLASPSGKPQDQQG